MALLKLVVDRGTGRAAALEGSAAGKTGTSQISRDAWFIGFDEGLVVGVWVGNDDDTPMNNMTGGKLPAVIWTDFLTGAKEIAAKNLAACKRASIQALSHYAPIAPVRGHIDRSGVLIVLFGAPQAL